MLDTAGGQRCRVESLIGSGAQGEVYLATVDGHSEALKWYYPQNATNLESQLETFADLIARGAPTDRFVWPRQVVLDPKGTSFGYLMPLLESRFVSMPDLMAGRVSVNFRTACTICLELSHSFLELHSKGLCYRDISFRNFFFDPRSGEVRIVDNDNVSINGQPGPVAGTPKFMAPEIVRGEKQPSTETDLFSLSVMLFHILIRHHPLEGSQEAEIRAFDLHAMRKLYGHQPVFIFDPNDDSNRPVSGYQDNALRLWPLYPQRVRAEFITAFGDGLRDPMKRVRESKWRKVFAQVRDWIANCGRCGRQNFLDADAGEGHLPNCWHCHQELRRPLRLGFSNYSVVLNSESCIFPHHVGQLYDFTRPVGRIVSHPTQPGLWGLENVSPSAWTVTKPTGEVAHVPPGKRAPLAPGVRISFGHAEGRVMI